MVACRDKHLTWIVVLCLLGSCAQRPVRELVPPSGIGSVVPSKDPYLKAHMKNGAVYVLSSWSVEAGGAAVNGEGELLGINRESMGFGHHRVPVDSVAVFETDRLESSPVVAPLAILTAASVVLSVACATNPKACFGSCPTFYLADHGNPALRAEGFSSSVAPCLEARDVDALLSVEPAGATLQVAMRNEALETHVVRSVNLLAVPCGREQRVFADALGATPDGEGFWLTRGLIAPSRVTDYQGDCRKSLVKLDRFERTSAADSTDLSRKETLEVLFDRVPGGPVGLVVAFRQTLLTTFLFYQTLAYLGPDAGSWFASLERSGARAGDLIGGIGALLGGIEVHVEEGPETWRTAGLFRETGPLAVNSALVPLGWRDCGPLKIRLVMARGAWRLDLVALTRLELPATAARVHPSAVLRDGSPDAGALESLLRSDRALVTFPGDEYTLVFDVPEENEQYELFLESQGYYLEWIREEWLSEEDPAAASMMLFDPARAVVEMAPRYKRVERPMEDVFWESRYARP